MDTIRKAGMHMSTFLSVKAPPYSDIASLLLRLRHDNEFTKITTSYDYRYLGYMPQGSQGYQLLALAQAIVVAIKLKRVLLIPHVFTPFKSESIMCNVDYCMEFADALSFTSLSDTMPDLKFVLLTSGNVELFTRKNLYRKNPAR